MLFEYNHQIINIKKSIKLYKNKAAFTIIFHCCYISFEIKIRNYHEL